MLLAVQIIFFIATAFAGYFDIKTRHIPLAATITMAFAGIAQIIMLHDSMRLLGAIPALLLYVFLWARTRSIGGGDVKMIFGIGLFFGLDDTLYIILIACLLGLMVSLFLNASLFKAAAGRVKSDSKESLSLKKTQNNRKKKTLEDIEAEVESEMSSKLRTTSIPFCTWLAIAAIAWYILLRIL